MVWLWLLERHEGRQAGDQCMIPESTIKFCASGKGLKTRRETKLKSKTFMGLG